MPKPVVHYLVGKEFPPPRLVVGAPAFVHPIDHTSPLVSNTRVAKTSVVVSIGENGVFETLNTVYQPVKETK